MRRGDKGPEVKSLQADILIINPSALPRWGADSDLGEETLHYAAIILGDTDPDDKAEIDDAERRKIAELAKAKRHQKTSYTDYRSQADATERKGLRAIATISAIVLHQTDCVLGESPARWRSVPIHFGITRAGQTIQLHDIAELLYHAHALNKFSIGIEIDGHFEGIEGDLKTYNDYDTGRKPQQPTPQQIAATKELIFEIAKEVERRGGKITQLLGHRQGHSSRVRDPGSKVWKEIVRPCQEALGLDWTSALKVWGSGNPIPQSWDERSAAKY